MRQTDKSRGLVPQVARGARTDMFRNRMSSLDPFLIPLEPAWAGGCHNGAALWRAMKAVGFTGGLRVVTEWATRKRKEEGTATRGNRQCKAPSARRIAHMMTTDRDKRSKTVAHTIAFIGESVPDLTNARFPFFVDQEANQNGFYMASSPYLARGQYRWHSSGEVAFGAAAYRGLVAIFHTWSSL
jgi:hypothetical protein